MQTLISTKELKLSGFICLLLITVILSVLVVAQSGLRFFTFEAESGQLSGQASTQSDSTASGELYLGFTTTSVINNTFSEMFTGNTGHDRFVMGVYHRNVDVGFWSGHSSNTWTADHDLNCGDVSTQRTLHSTVSDPNEDELVFVCRDHLMSSMGDVDGYSIVWFSPDGNKDKVPDSYTSANISKVSWDVSVTNLGARQWWEVMLVPEGTPHLATVDWVASTAEIDPYDSKAIVMGSGPFGNDGNIFSGGNSQDPLTFCHIHDCYDVEGSLSKMIRRPFSMIDNRNGTVTFNGFNSTWTYPGKFPDKFSVYFKDHNYTPDKDGVPIGHTWHWDSIVVN
jgi:hypothetical protein